MQRTYLIIYQLLCSANTVEHNSAMAMVLIAGWYAYVLYPEFCREKGENMPLVLFSFEFSFSFHFPAVPNVSKCSKSYCILYFCVLYVEMM